MRPEGEIGPMRAVRGGVEGGVSVPGPRAHRVRFRGAQVRGLGLDDQGQQLLGQVVPLQGTLSCGGDAVEVSHGGSYRLRTLKKKKAQATPIKTRATSHGWRAHKSAIAAMDIQRVVVNHKPRTPAAISAAVMENRSVASLLGFGALAGFAEVRSRLPHSGHGHLLKGHGGHVFMQTAVVLIRADQAQMLEAGQHETCRVH